MSPKRHIVIAIDGPAGAGKSTVARLLAKSLGFVYVDSGALYRAVALILLRQGITDAITLSEEVQDEALRTLLDEKSVVFGADSEGGTRLVLRGEDVSAEIRTSGVEKLVPFVAQHARIRAGVTRLQRELARHRSAVVEGRDAGTVVFPDAGLKFFLDATPEARGRRRFLQLRRNSPSASLPTCIEDIKRRDLLDKKRRLAPLVKPEDAVYVDTSENTVSDTLRQVLAAVAARLHLTPRIAIGSLPQRSTLIAVAGPIGVGKSTLCAWLARELGLPLFSENPDDNPYIRRCYLDPDRWALQSQMWFLHRKYELLNSISDEKMGSVIDRTLHEDYMFARMLLRDEDLALYEQWYGLVFLLAPRPDVVISLEASVEELLRRIHRRGRDYEKHMSKDRLAELNEAYTSWVSKYDEGPLIRVDTERDDVRSDSVRAKLLGWLFEAAPTLSEE